MKLSRRQFFINSALVCLAFTFETKSKILLLADILEQKSPKPSFAENKRLQRIPDYWAV